MSSSAVKKRSASADADESSSSQRPRVAPGPNRFSSIFEVNSLLSQLVDNLPAPDIQSLRDTTKTLNRKIAEVPTSLATVTPTKEARNYANELLAKEHVRKFLVDFFFPLEEELNMWLHRNEDLIKLFDRSIPLERNSKRNVLYENSADLRGEGDESFADSVFRACPANKPFCRSFQKLWNMRKKITEVAARVRELDHLNEQRRIHFYDIWNHFEKYLNKFMWMTGLYDDSYKTTGTGFFIAIREVVPFGDIKQETNDNILYRNEPVYLDSYTYEHFVKVAIPLLLTTFRVQIVYTQCSFSVVDRVFDDLTRSEKLNGYAEHIQRYIVNRFRNDYKRIPTSAYSPDSTIRQQTVSSFFPLNKDEEKKQLQPSADVLFAKTDEQMHFAYQYELGHVYIFCFPEHMNVPLRVMLQLDRLKSKHILQAARDQVFRDTLRNKIYRPPTEAIPDYDTNPNALVRRLETALQNLNSNLSNANLGTAQ